MATPTKIHLTTETTGVVHVKPQTAETAARTSELLQENHDKHHMYFGTEGFHNHIAHHLLTLFGVGATTAQIEQAYKDNAHYQNPPKALDERIIQDMSNPENFKKYLGNEEYYHDFLIFFQTEMEAKGWENTLQQYMFSGTELANDIFGRMYDGFLHPIIHLGFGIEFQQPAIICEALAQACTHNNWTSQFLYSIDSALKSTPNPASTNTIPQLLSSIRDDKTLSTAAHWNDPNKIRDGIIPRAGPLMTSYCLQYTTSPSTLTQQTVEMINSSIYFTASAQHPPKQVKFDFYYMHCVNASIFFPVFNSLPWLSDENRIKLLNFKVWLDLTMYASRRSPELFLEEISLYTPAKLPAETSMSDGHGSMLETEWQGIFQRLADLKEDDGHSVKLGRAVRNGEILSENYEGEEWCMIKGFMWEKIGNMVIDSVEDRGVKWVRSAGFDEAWENYEDRPRKAEL